MYQRILIPLENSPSDDTILQHILSLGEICRSQLFLLHVADGWAARNYEYFGLRESEEMVKDQEYLREVAHRLSEQGFQVEHRLGKGDPASEIIRFADELKVDLIAMSTHGHRFFCDLFYGSTADKVRHMVDIPVLLLKARKA